TREGRDAALDSRLHQRKQVPGHRTPGRSDEGILLFVESQVVEINLDDRAAIGEGLISDRPRGFLHPDELHAAQPLAYQWRRSGDVRVMGRRVVPASTPAECQRIRIE